VLASYDSGLSKTVAGNAWFRFSQRRSCSACRPVSKSHTNNDYTFRFTLPVLEIAELLCFPILLIPYAGFALIALPLLFAIAGCGLAQP